MAKSNPPVPGPKVTLTDADRLIASYGQPVSPEKKAALMSRLQSQRGEFDRAQKRPARPAPERGRD